MNRVAGMRQALLFALLLSLGCFVASCKKAQEKPNGLSKMETPKKGANEPKHVQVQHILIGFKGSIPGKNIDRNLKDAEKLAKQVLKRARIPNADFASLVRAFSSDRVPGIYGLSNFGVKPQGKEFNRSTMVPAFGNVGFKLKVGEVKMAPFDRKTSPYGFHIIKRLK